MDYENDYSVLISQWQRKKGTSSFYLFWRWLIFSAFLFIAICSLVDIGRDGPETCNRFFYLKWFIYLTHWTMVFCLIQSLIAAILCTYSFTDRENEFSNFLKKIYRPIYANAVVFGFTITIWYWTLIHKPQIHPVDFQNFLSHIFMGGVMLADLMTTGHKLRIKPDLRYTVTVAISFTVFTYIYYITGGTDCKGGDLIYPVLNWAKPAETWLFCGGKAVFVAMVHLVTFCLCKIRIFIYEKFYCDNIESMSCHEDEEMESTVKGQA